jgi:uncharacterized protein
MHAGFLAEVANRPEAHFGLKNATTGALVAERLEPAFDSERRRRGLLGRDGLAPDTALVIAPSNSVHTFFMRFAIDVVFVARDGRVIKVRRGVRPGRLAMALTAFAVIEMAADHAGGGRVSAGDRLQVIPRSPSDDELKSAVRQNVQG